MTRNELKQLVRQVLNEGRVRRTPPRFNAALRMAAADFKANRDANLASKKKDDDEFEKIASQSPNLSGKIVNIKHRIGVLDDKIAQLETQIGNTDNKTPEEMLKMIPTLKSKTQFEIDRLEEYINLQTALKELVVTQISKL
jgi:predicted  nucleic acid-binding Zn-ribbon protein